MDAMEDVDVYPVGLFLALKQKRFHEPLSYLRYQFNHRNFRAIRQYFNGYLAESSHGTRCGHGWTKRRAVKDLTYHLANEI